MRKTCILTFILTIYLAFGLSSALEQDIDYNAVSQALTQATLTHPDLIWPDFNFSDVQVIMIDGAKNEALVWSGPDNGSLSGKSYYEIPDAFLSSKTASGYLRGIETVSTRVDLFNFGPREVLAAVLGQAFKVRMRKSLDMPERDLQWDKYPKDWRARYLRRQIMKALYDAYVLNDQRSIGNAVFWHNSYSSKFPIDRGLHRKTDIVYGAAEFVAVNGTTIGMISREAGPEKVSQYIKDWLTQKWDNDLNDLKAARSMDEQESRSIGLLAGLIMDKNGFPGWKLKVSEGVPPMDILAQFIRPILSHDNAVLMDRVRAYYDARNGEVKAETNVCFAERNNENYKQLTIPLEWARSAGLNDPDLVSIGFGGVERKMISRLTETFISPVTNSRIELVNSTAEFYDAPYPYGGYSGYIIVTVKNDELTGANGSYSVNSKTISSAGIKMNFSADGKWGWLK
jgi:hypothetical protein